MRNEEERCPENCGADGEMILEMAGGGAKFGFGLVVFVEARAAEAFVGELIVFGEIETVLDERSASKSIIADAVAAHPGIQKRKGEEAREGEAAARIWENGAREMR